MTELSGEVFLHKKDPQLHTTWPVGYEQEHKKAKGLETTQKPPEKIRDFLTILKQTHGHKDYPETAVRIKESYHKEYVIRPEEIPQSYWNSQAEQMIREGRGGDLVTMGIKKEVIADTKGERKVNYIFPDRLKQQQAELLMDDQKTTLDLWLDYFMSPDSDIYPMWAKYWAFTGMVKLSTFDKGKHEFGRRDNTTVAPFADLNREALSYTVNALVNKVENKIIPTNNPDLVKLLHEANFGELYAYAIEHVTPAKQTELLETKGEWRKYPKGSNHTELATSLQGHGTGWCTAVESTAEAQLKTGDFYVYYSLDEEGKPTVPRLAIRMEGYTKIAEIRGIAKAQNIDPYISDVLETKLTEFGNEGEIYKKKVVDMRRLTEVYSRHIKDGLLNKDDLRFLYELDDGILGFGYSKDPRIAELLQGRDIKADIASLIGCTKEEVSTTQQEALQGKKKLHYGNLYIDDETLKRNPRFPKAFNDFLYLIRYMFNRKIQLPETILGDLKLPFLSTLRGIQLPETVLGNLDLSGPKSADGSKLPKKVRGDIFLYGLKTAQGLRLPENYSGKLNLRGLVDASGLVFPETFKGELILSKLRTARGLKLPKAFEGELDLSGLVSSEGLILPEIFNGIIRFGNFVSYDSLTFPDGVNAVYVPNFMEKDLSERYPGIHFIGEFRPEYYV